MQQPLVSIIMPVYNVERFLMAAIDSALNQTYEQFELILINDASTDRSKKICLSQTDERVRFIDNPHNMGVLRSRNIALAHSKGDYIAWLDSDDLAMPDRLRKQVAFLEANPGYSMCGSWYHEIDGDDERIRSCYLPTKDADLRSYLLLANGFCNSSSMVRGNLMRQLKFSEDFEVAEDYDLWYRISKSGKLANLPEFLTEYRVHGNNISIRKKELMFNMVQKLAKQMLSDAGIQFTQAELDIHSRLMNFEGAYFNSAVKLKCLEDWIMHLYRQLIHKESYTNKILFGMLAERWQVVCTQNKRYGSLVWNQLMRQNPFQYLVILVRKVLKRPMQF